VAETALVRRTGADRARERSEIERRRVMVARFRFLEANMTAAEIVTALGELNPPIFTSIRTVERDITVIRENGRRYISAKHFDAPFEVSAALARHELIARTATQRALAGNGDSARWARIAIRATEARTTLLQDLGLLDRRIGTLFIDDGNRANRIPSGVELRKLFDSITVTDAEITSEAELAYRYGDAAAHEAAGRDAQDAEHYKG
jgi:hypothetical protein